MFKKIKVKKPRIIRIIAPTKHAGQQTDYNELLV